MTTAAQPNIPGVDSLPKDVREFLESLDADWRFAGNRHKDRAHALLAKYANRPQWQVGDVVRLDDHVLLRRAPDWICAYCTEVSTDAIMTTRSTETVLLVRDGQSVSSVSGRSWEQDKQTVVDAIRRPGLLRGISSNERTEYLAKEILQALIAARGQRAEATS